MAGDFETAIVDLEYEVSSIFLDVEGRKYFSKEELGVEDLLVLKLFVPDALDAAVTSHQLALTSHLLSKVLNVFSFEQVAGLGASVAEVDLVSETAHSVEQFLGSWIAPILGIPGAFIDAKSNGMEGILGWTVLALVLSLTVVQQSMDKTSRALSHATYDQWLVFVLCQHSQLKDFPQLEVSAAEDWRLFN